MIAIDPRMLIDSVTLNKQKKDHYGKYESLGDPIILPKVRVDRTKVYAYQGDARVLVANMVVFVYPRYTSTPSLDDEWEGAQIIVDGQAHTVVSISQQSEPYSHSVFSYEIEVK